MARFRGTVQGARGEASRLGHTKTGLTVTANGWNSGVRVEAHGGAEDDAFDIYMTPGSNGAGQRVLLGRVVWNASKRERRFEPVQS